MVQRFLLVLVGVTLLATKPGLTQSTEAEIWAGVDAFYKAYRAGDVDRMMSSYHPNYINWGYARSETWNRQRLRQAFEAWVKSGDKVTELSVKRVGVTTAGSTAIACFYTTETVQHADGKTETSTTRWMEVFVREGDKWLIVGDHGGPFKPQ